MRKKTRFKIILTGTLFFVFLWSNTLSALEEKVSGSVRDGYRILILDLANPTPSFTVYRGDYIKFKLPESIQNADLYLAGAKQEKPLEQDLNTTPYFKMKKTGEILFQVATIQGRIKVIEYNQAHYRAMTAEQAASFIESDHPFILDVRTPREYKIAHIENSTLIPVQVLKSRIDELSAHKTSPILIYCASGNRSTVASKILIDNGFSNIVNLKYGINDWYRRKFKIIR